jgi:methyltransferase (TIGR00027 family)
MKPGQPSQTAVMVCSWRALAQGRTSASRFDDPTALPLLPEEARRAVEAQRAAPPRGVREKLVRGFTETRAQMMVARTVEIDDRLREAHHPQVVILGAGLDGRAWRLPELMDAVVFEVDQPDSQRLKRERVGTLTQRAREVHFVPVDFAVDRLEEALEKAGHDTSRPTTWVWEGVVMYLTPRAVEQTLDQVARRSAPGSRLVVQYNGRALVMTLLGLSLRRLGEPLRSAYSPAQMRELLQRHGFAVVRDESIASIGAQLSPELGERVRYIRHSRIATAHR